MAMWLDEKEKQLIKELADKGYKVSYIAWKTGRDKKTVSKYAGKKITNRITEEEIKKAIYFKKFGFTDKEISEQLGRTRAAVSQMFSNIRRGKYGSYSI